MKSALEYKWFILGFLLLPLFTGIYLLTPYVRILGFPGLYYQTKPWGLQVFHDKQTLWSVVGILSAGLGVIIGLTVRQQEIEKEKMGAIYSFYEEILRNINQIFSGELERVYDTDGLQRIKDHFNSAIKDFNKFRKIHELYNELNFYREVQVAVRWGAPALVTERQFSTCNKFLEYFGQHIDPASVINHQPPYQGSEWEQIRDAAISMKDANLNTWKTKLRTDFKKMFALNKFNER